MNCFCLRKELLFFSFIGSFCACFLFCFTIVHSLFNFLIEIFFYFSKLVSLFSQSAKCVFRLSCSAKQFKINISVSKQNQKKKRCKPVWLNFRCRLPELCPLLPSLMLIGFDISPCLLSLRNRSMFSSKMTSKWFAL